MNTQSLKEALSLAPLCEMYIQGLVFEFLNEEDRTTSEILNYLRSTSRLCPFENLGQMDEFMYRLAREHKVLLIVCINSGSKTWSSLKVLQPTPATPILPILTAFEKGVNPSNHVNPIKMTISRQRVPTEKDIQREILKTLSSFQAQLDDLDLLEESKYRLQCYLEELKETETNQN